MVYETLGKIVCVEKIYLNNIGIYNVILKSNDVWCFAIDAR